MCPSASLQHIRHYLVFTPVGDPDPRFFLGDKDPDPRFFLGDKDPDPRFFLGDKDPDPRFFLGDKDPDPVFVVKQLTKVMNMFGFI